VSLQLDLFNRSLAFRNFDRLSRGASASFGYRPFRHNRFWRDLTIFAGYRVEDIQLRNVTTTRSSRFFQSGITSSLTQGISLDRRNDRFAPTRGYYLALNNDWADASWGSEFEFDRVRGIVRGYRSMDFLNCSEQGESVAGGARVVQGACRWFRSWVFRTNFEIGYIGATRADEVVPVSERFYRVARTACAASNSSRSDRVYRPQRVA
jgi:outer membrane protein insertion porin family